MADNVLRDIVPVMWKERKGLFRLRGRHTKYFLNLLTPLVLAIMQPLRDGPEWVAQEGSVVLAAISAMLLVFITVPDSFAGERERHTLGTLLASRIIAILAIIDLAVFAIVMVRFRRSRLMLH
jgi:ABC-2 type transport system permease protein